MRTPASLPYFVRTGNQNKEKLKDYLQENDYIVFTIKNSYRVCTLMSIQYSPWGAKRTSRPFPCHGRVIPRWNRLDKRN